MQRITNIWNSLSRPVPRPLSAAILIYSYFIPGGVCAYWTLRVTSLLPDSFNSSSPRTRKVPQCRRLFACSGTIRGRVSAPHGRAGRICRLTLPEHDGETQSGRSAPAICAGRSQSWRPLSALHSPGPRIGRQVIGGIAAEATASSLRAPAAFSVRCLPKFLARVQLGLCLTK